MANVLGDYNLIFFAQEALIHLWKALGMAPRIHMGYSEERRAFGRGETIQIRKPSTFTVANAPDVTGQDLATEVVTITLDQWKEVKFNLTDKELAFTQEEIIQEHVAPMAYALANEIDQKCAALYKDIPWADDVSSGTPVVAGILDPRKRLFNNDVPIQDQQFMHYMIDGNLEAGFLSISAFAQHQGAGNIGVDSQLRGSLGMKYGVEIFANQNTPTHTKGTSTDGDQDVDGELAKGATSMNTTLASDTGTIVPGDTFVFTGFTQRYAVTNSTTGSGTAHTNITFTPATPEIIPDATLITFILDTHVANLMFHRNAFAIVLAPLPEIGNELGARIVTVTDPITKLSLRSRIFYEGKTSKVSVAMDVLYGVKTLDPNLATRGAGEII